MICLITYTTQVCSHTPLSYKYVGQYFKDKGLTVTSTSFFLIFKVETRMLFLCKGSSRKRIILACSRFYSSTELFKIARESNRNTPLYLEYGPNLYQPIINDNELRFVCQLLEGDIASYMSPEDCEANRLCVLDSAHTSEYERLRKPPRVKSRVTVIPRTKQTDLSPTTSPTPSCM